MNPPEERLWVLVETPQEDVRIEQAPFDRCLLHLLGVGDEQVHKTRARLVQRPDLSLLLASDTLLTSSLSAPLSNQGEFDVSQLYNTKAVPMGHSPHCPIAQLAKQKLERDSPEISETTTTSSSTDLTDTVEPITPVPQSNPSSSSSSSASSSSSTTISSSSSASVTVSATRPPRLLLGVVVLIESTERDGSHKVLLTRRRDDAYLFPSIWVLPGGHAEPGETILEVGVREVQEETGVMVDRHQMCLFALWESVYPDRLEYGLPHKHHFVIYLKATLKTSAEETPLLLQEEEVSAAAWLDRDRMTTWLGLEEEKDAILRTYQLGIKERVYSEKVKNTLLEKLDKKDRDTVFPSLRFGSNNNNNTESGSSQPQLQQYSYEMVTEWLALGHRFALNHWIRQ
jgi:8-oxo-dGTP pyrophosphatase MutT (NUDIX family)